MLRWLIDDPLEGRFITLDKRVIFSDPLFDHLGKVENTDGLRKLSRKAYLTQELVLLEILEVVLHEGQRNFTIGIPGDPGMLQTLLYRVSAGTLDLAQLEE